MQLHLCTYVGGGSEGESGECKGALPSTSGLWGEGLLGALARGGIRDVPPTPAQHGCSISGR